MTDLLALAANLKKAQVVDLSQTLEEHMPCYPSHSKFFHNLWGSYWHGGRSLSYQLVMNEHTGTHVDAPAHFISDAKPDAHRTIDAVPPDRLIGRGARIDCRKFSQGQYASRAFVEEWKAQHGGLNAGDVVLFDFGWSAHWALRPQGQRYLEDWPGIGMDAAEYLIEKSVAAIGVDTLSPDPPDALRTNLIHPKLLENQVLIVENLCNLERLPDFFLFIALPLKIRNGSGSPVRALALF